MPSKKISELTALTTPADGDLHALVDVSDTSMAAAGTDKKITQANLLASERARLDSVESGRFIVPPPTGVLATDTANILAKIQAAAAAKGVCEIPGATSRYVCAVDVASLSHVKIRGEAVLHNPTAGDDALSLTDCPDAEIEGIWVQGESGTRDGIRLVRCNRARVRVRCQGTGGVGVYAEECIAIQIDSDVGIDVASPYPTGVANATGGVKLTWDGVNADSGCNQFYLDGWYVIGQTQGWAVEIIRAEGGTIGGPVAELSKSGILLDTCENVQVDGYYGEGNPSLAAEYTTGTVSTTNGSTTVTGSGTAWNAADGGFGATKNAQPGKFLIIGTTWARIASIQSDTQITLETPWGGATASGQSYRMQSVDLYLKDSKGCTVNWGRGSGVLLKGSSLNRIRLLTESMFLDSGSNQNEVDVIVGRANNPLLPDRVVNNGNGNAIRQTDYWTGNGVGDRVQAQKEFTRGVFADPAPGIAAAIKANDNVAFDRIYGTEQADPSAPPSNLGVIYFRDSGAGKTQLVARFNTGAVQVIATEP